MYVCIYGLRNLEQSFEKAYFIVKSKNPPPPFVETNLHCRVYQCPQIVFILSQTNRFHFLPIECEDPSK